MRLIKFAVVLIVSLMVAPIASEGQRVGRVPRIAYLGTRTPSDFGLVAFRQALRELGWVEGQNLVIEYRFAEGRLDRLPDLAAELARLKVDVIVAHSTPGATAVKRATETIPIVMISVGDPVGLGLVANLARPGGNLTGLSYSAFGLEIIGKQLELFKEAIPKIRRVAILSNGANPTQPLAIREVNVAARSLAVQLQVLEVRGPNEFDGAFAAMAKDRVGGLLVVPDSMFVFQRTLLADRAAKTGLPAVYGCGGRRPHVLWAGLGRSLPARCDLCGQDHAGFQTRSQLLRVAVGFGSRRLRRKPRGHQVDLKCLYATAWPENEAHDPHILVPAEPLIVALTNAMKVDRNGRSVVGWC
jgi:putative ABC transport system substrate-binding protein